MNKIFLKVETDIDLVAKCGKHEIFGGEKPQTIVQFKIWDRIHYGLLCNLRAVGGKKVLKAMFKTLPEIKLNPKELSFAIGECQDPEGMLGI